MYWDRLATSVHFHAVLGEETLVKKFVFSVLEDEWAVVKRVRVLVVGVDVADDVRRQCEEAHSRRSAKS